MKAALAVGRAKGIETRYNLWVKENLEVYASAAHMAEARKEKLKAVTEMRTMRRKCAIKVLLWRKERLPINYFPRDVTGPVFSPEFSLSSEVYSVSRRNPNVFQSG